MNEQRFNMSHDESDKPNLKAEPEPAPGAADPDLRAARPAGGKKKLTGGALLAAVMRRLDARGFFGGD